jgi:NADH:ubiquinone reductase (H+-translocating)
MAGARLRSCSETVPKGLYSTEAPGAAGVVASPAARWLDAEHDRAGRVKVGVDLAVPSHSDIFAVGDTAAVTDQPGIPSTAP